MHRYLLTILLLFACTGAWAQASAAQDDTEARESQESEEADAADEADDLDLDEESYMDAEEEDFVPSEDIPADQAIPFPTDI
jgi:hypothetical protein